MLIEAAGWRLLTDPTFDPPGRRYSFGWGTASRKEAGPAVQPSALGPLDFAARLVRIEWQFAPQSKVIVVAERLGHENATLVLSTYGHLMPDSEERTRRAVDEAWGCAPGVPQTEGTTA